MPSAGRRLLTPGHTTSIRLKFKRNNYHSYDLPPLTPVPTINNSRDSLQLLNILVRKWQSRLIWLFVVARHSELGDNRPSSPGKRRKAISRGEYLEVSKLQLRQRPSGSLYVWRGRVLWGRGAEHTPRPNWPSLRSTTPITHHSY